MRAAANEYRAKTFECLSLAECMNDPERRAEILRYARWWTQLTERIIKGFAVDWGDRWRRTVWAQLQHIYWFRVSPDRQIELRQRMSNVAPEARVCSMLFAL